ncbi:uncharacterized protein BDV17DRAFT_292955 [Aspergillus undulatus]|uniref:uncharacterized protein n=1 Tax=Aspergillus undulatus TaxID=1810928 RepID=UPI003CCD859F
MHLSKSYTLMALALAAGSASGHASEKVEAADESTTIEASAATTSAPSKVVHTSVSPAITTVPEKIETVYASHTTWVITTTTVCEKSSCAEKHTSTPAVVPYPSPSPQHSNPAQPQPQPQSSAAHPSGAAKQPSVSIPVVKSSAPAYKGPASASASSAPAQSQSQIPSASPAASSAPVIPSSAPAATSTPLIKSTPAASKTVPSSSAHKSSTQHKPTSTSSHEDSKQDEEDDISPAPEPTDDLTNPGSKLRNVTSDPVQDIKTEPYG